MILPRGNKGEGSSLRSFPSPLEGIQFTIPPFPGVPKMEESSPTEVNSMYGMYGIFTYICIYLPHLYVQTRPTKHPKSSDPSDSVLPFLPSFHGSEKLLYLKVIARVFVGPIFHFHDDGRKGIHTYNHFPKKKTRERKRANRIHQSTFQKPFGWYTV